MSMGYHGRMLTGLLPQILLLALVTVGHVPYLWAQEKIHRLGVMALTEATMSQPSMLVFEPELAKHGFVVGKNLHIEYRYGSGAELSHEQNVQELINAKVDAIFAVAAPMGKVAFARTKTIPLIIQDYTNDPVALGYAKSYNRPGKNVTGVFLDAPEFAGKWVEILREMVPGLKELVVMWDPKPGRMHLDAAKATAGNFGLKVTVREVATPEQMESVFRRAQGRLRAMIILPSPLNYTFAERLAELARKYKVPAASMAKAFALKGGAVSYGPNNTESTLRNAEQVAKVLSGRPVGEIPVERPYKYDFVINMQAVREMKLHLPDRLLLGAELVGK